MKNLLARFQKALHSGVFWLFAVALVLLIIVSTSISKSVDTAYDPNSTAPDGTKAAFLTLQQLGMNVSTGPKITGNTIIVFRDDFTEKQLDDLAEWVRTGGTLILTDPGSSLASGKFADAPAAINNRLTPKCSAPWARGVTSVDISGTTSPSLLEATDGSTGCFPAGTNGFLAVQSDNELGTVVEVFTPEIFTNAEIGKADNAVLLANLVDARKGSSVSIMTADTSAAPESGNQGLLSLVPSSLEQALIQLMIAVLVLALWKGRRLGRLVTEPQPVELPASSLVLAVGELLQQAGQANGAGKVLRRDLRRRLAQLIGVSSEVPPGVLAQIVSRRTGIDERRLAQALIDAPIGSGESLLALAQTIEDVHREVANAR